MRLKRWFCCLLWGGLVYVLAPAPALAQYRFDSWSPEQGLPHKHIHALLQTRDGYLWMTTTDGLVRFDGVHFTVFDTAGGRGFASNRCTALIEDRQGDLWIGTEDNGVMRYRDGRFTTYTTADGLPRNDVRDISETATGDLVISTFKGTAQRHDGQFSVYMDNFGLVPYASDTMDNKGGVWSSDGYRLQRLSAQGMIYYPLDPGLAPAGPAAAFYDRQGGLWIGVKEPSTRPGQRGLYYLKDGKTTIYTPKDGLPETAVSCFFEDREGNLWMGTLADGLIRFRDGRFTRYTTADGLSSNRITAVYQDREGSIWVGTFDNGLNRMSKQIITTISMANGLAADNTYPIYEDPSGTIWVGGWGNRQGLTKIKNGQFTHYGDKDGLIGLLMSLLKDRDGALWIGAYGTLTRMRDGKFEQLAKAGTPFKINIPDAGVLAILQDREGAIWFGTIEGLARYKDGATTTYTTKDGLPDKFIQTLYESRDGTLWIGTRGGLAHFVDGRFVAYTESEGVAGTRVRCIYEDSDGVLWIGTYDSGLTRIKDGRFTRYTIKEGLFNNGAFQILEDRRGNLWMSCNKGIYSVSKQELNDFAAGRIHSITSISFDKKDGMLDEECNGGMQPAGCRTRDGRFWFPTQKGVAIIDPEAVPRNPLPPPVLIEAFTIQRQPVDLQAVMRIAPDQDDFEIHYTGLSFIKSEYVKFRYQMVGLDADWVDAGTRRAIYYSHLPPGDYTFRVIAANSDGVWNTEGASIRIIILPPFYRTWWFIALMVASTVAVAVVVYRWRVSRLERARAAQEVFSRRLIDSQEQERKRIAAELHDSLGQNLLIIKNRALLGAMKTETSGAAAREQFDEITDSASQAIDEVREIAYNLRPHHLDRLGLTKTLEAMIEKIASASEFHLTSEIAPLEGLFGKDQEINLYRVVQESLNNIVKHSAATEARIEIAREPRSVQIIIRDNGKGFAPEMPAATESRGFGLTGIAERVRMLGGTHTIHSVPGQGTTITIKLGLQIEQQSKHDEK